MTIYFGADHGGFQLKEELKSFVQSKGYEVADAGAFAYDDKDDFPDFAGAVGSKVSFAPDRSRGVVICRSGAGVDIVANKFRNVRSVLGISADQVYDSRKDVNANVLALAADFISKEDARKMLEVFLSTPFAGEERLKRRLMKVAQVEEEAARSSPPDL